MQRTGGLFFTKLGIILLCFVGSICEAQEESRCTVPFYSRTGTCVGFDRCEELKRYFFPSGKFQLLRGAREELDHHTRTCRFKGKLPLICCPNESVSHVPARKNGDDFNEKDYDDSFKRGTAEDSRSDESEKAPERGSSAGQRNSQAAGRRNLTGDVRPGNRVSKNPPPNQVTGHKNFHLLPRNCGRSGSRDRISNGNKTGIFEFPWMALIAYNKKSGLRFSCAGTIINKFYILTAAHCVTNLDQDTIAGLRVGEHDYSSEKDCEGADEFEFCAPPYQDFVPDEIIIHPSYGGLGKNGARSKLQHDIALVRLGLPIDLNQNNAKPICLPTTPELQQVNLDNQKLLVAGWGVTEAKKVSFDLLKATLPIVPNDACHKIYSRSHTDGISVRQMCAGGVGGVDSCGGDSGGPLKLETRVGNKFVFVQHGIVSYGPSSCGSTGWPGVYTRLAYYMNWILDHMKP